MSQVQEECRPGLAVVTRREAFVGLGWAAAASAAVAASVHATLAAEAAETPQSGQPSYRETDHIRRFYDCARF
jgi:hypothetical protein